jgi:hypothetical protein
VPANSLLSAQDFDLIINDSRCAGVFYSPEFAKEVELAIAGSSWRPLRVSRIEGEDRSLTTLARRRREVVVIYTGIRR